MRNDDNEQKNYFYHLPFCIKLIIS